MTERITLTQTALLCAYAASISAGQILFKLAAQRMAPGTLVERGVGLAHDWAFLLALVVYFSLALVWVWILSFIPLSRAYPFVALAFALTPALGCLLFAEPFTWRLAVGTVVILVGLVLVAG